VASSIEGELGGVGCWERASISRFTNLLGRGGTSSGMGVPKNTWDAVKNQLGVLLAFIGKHEGGGGEWGGNLDKKTLGKAKWIGGGVWERGGCHGKQTEMGYPMGRTAESNNAPA